MGYINTCFNFSTKQLINIYVSNFSQVRIYCCHKYCKSATLGSYLFNYLKTPSISKFHYRVISGVAKKPNLTKSVLKTRLSDLINEHNQDSINSNVNLNQSDTSSNTGSKDSWFSGKNAWKFGLFCLTLSGILSSGAFILIYGKPLLDQEGNETIDEFTIMPLWKAYLKRSSKELLNFKKMIQEPSSQKLLPDPVKEPWFQPPYTLVLEMTDVLVHPDWTLGTGWRFKKRPALDYFLQQVGPPLFEVVIYTHEQGFTAFPIIEGLDPNGYIMFKLFRDATRYKDGTHVKDLTCLNRDLSKVIIVDCDSKAISMQPQNAFLLKRWDGNDSDRSLVDLATFLRTIATNNVEDVRSVLEYYSQFEDPIATFKEKQKLLKQQDDERAVSSKMAIGPKTSSRWSFRGLGRHT